MNADRHSEEEWKRVDAVAWQIALKFVSCCTKQPVSEVEKVEFGNQVLIASESAPSGNHDADKDDAHGAVADDLSSIPDAELPSDESEGPDDLAMCEAESLPEPTDPLIKKFAEVQAMVKLDGEIEIEQDHKVDETEQELQDVASLLDVLPKDCSEFQEKLRNVFARLQEVDHVKSSASFLEWVASLHAFLIECRRQSRCLKSVLLLFQYLDRHCELSYVYFPKYYFGNFSVGSPLSMSGFHSCISSDI